MRAKKEVIMSRFLCVIGVLVLALFLAPPSRACDPYNICAGGCDDGNPCTLDRCFAGSPICGCVHESYDWDADGVCDLLDNCTGATNPDQADSDGDGIGDVCDACQSSDHADSDGDGLEDVCDPCPNSDLRPTVVVAQCESRAPNYHHSDGCTTADRVDACHLGADSHGAFVSCVAAVTLELSRAGELAGDERGSIVRCAAGE